MSRGKRVDSEIQRYAEEQLQFGHGCEPWKTPGVNLFATGLYRGLQFGHGCEPWKTLNRLLMPSAGRSLQFGHGCEPWKTAVQFPLILLTILASIRPRL